LPVATVYPAAAGMTADVKPPCQPSLSKFTVRHLIGGFQVGIPMEIASCKPLCDTFRHRLTRRSPSRITVFGMTEGARQVEPALNDALTAAVVKKVLDRPVSDPQGFRTCIGSIQAWVANNGLTLHPTKTKPAMRTEKTEPRP
jgi:hypothetical protein